MRLPPLLVLATLVSTPLAQDVVQLDFGTPTLLTTATGWNNVTPDNQGAGLDLVTSSGAPSGLRIDAIPGKGFGSSLEAGTTSPTGALAAQGWPTSAVSDAMWSDQGVPEAELVISGLDPGSSYDVVLSASRLGVSDVRTGRYTVSGFFSASGVLDAANNTSQVLLFPGVIPDLEQRITLRVSADATNTNPNKYYYLGVLSLSENLGGATGALLGFASDPLAFGRREGQAPFQTTFEVRTYDGASPSVALSAVDDATLGPPSWLSVPPTVTAGTPFPLTVGGAALAPGTYSATLSGSAAGYPLAETTVTLQVRAQGSGLNVLYYGNSYSQANGTVPVVVDFLAEAAGIELANTVARLVGGQNLAFHLNDPTQAAAITTTLPLGESWDFVVLQGLSTEATVALGNPEMFRANAQAIVENVKAHSPAARCCLYQTWARAPGEAVYLRPDPSFSGPLEMHRQIETSYTLAQLDMNTRWGPDTARRAPAGECAALENWKLSLYNPDLSHPSPALTLYASLAIFQELYRYPLCELDPDFGGPGALAAWLASYGLSPAQWDAMVGIAERVEADSARSYPGSGEDLLLRSQVAGGPLTACSHERVRSGDQVTITVQSPAGTFFGAPTAIFLEAFPYAGALAPDPLYPELWIDPSGATVLLSLGALSEGMKGTSFVVPPMLGGARFLVQARVLATSYQTGNPLATTDAHELSLEPRFQRRAPTPQPR